MSIWILMAASLNAQESAMTGYSRERARSQQQLE